MQFFFSLQNFPHFGYVYLFHHDQIQVKHFAQGYNIGETVMSFSMPPSRTHMSVGSTVADVMFDHLLKGVKLEPLKRASLYIRVICINMHFLEKDIFVTH